MSSVLFRYFLRRRNRNSQINDSFNAYHRDFQRNPVSYVYVYGGKTVLFRFNLLVSTNFFLYADTERTDSGVYHFIVQISRFFCYWK